MSEPEPDWPTVVELQRTELDRLLRENARLRENVDRLMQLQEREQVLRQQLQGQLERLTERMALPPPDSGKRQEARLLEARLLASEQKFTSLKQAVGLLVDHLETSRRQSRRDAGAHGLVSGRGRR